MKKGSCKLLCVGGLGAAGLSVPQAAGGGNFSSCPRVNHPVPGPEGSRGSCRGSGGPRRRLKQQSRRAALAPCYGHNCQSLCAFSFWFCFDGYFFFLFFVIGPAQNRITRSVLITFQIIYTLFLVLTLCMQGCVTAALMFPCDTEAYLFFPIS